ncbi:helix-turn-helix transcriptional regulator [Glutamicibacter halophytocola]|uniref:Helix-turn-helix transcriptional regulator n=1 Tax=Glutamicibacter halophytocola TaxID=1933880 RepID=A0ABX5Y9Q9_9MICC|nr:MULTISPECIES: metalloregulator ArsR/SmtB family transcription factor [Glutamicibacter]QDY66398.1 helix-turn-helix transcriptional regulator [Glutamicibacter halophytocola]
MLDLLEVASEPTRRRLIQLLGSGERTVTELAANFTVSRSAISQHLLLLIDVGLLQARKDGRSRYYSLNPAGIAKLKVHLDSFWNTELDLLVAEAADLAALGTLPNSPQNPPGETP